MSTPRSPASTGSSRSGADGSVDGSARGSRRGLGYARADAAAPCNSATIEGHVTPRWPEHERAVDLELTGMTCAACAARIEKVLNRVGRRARGGQFRDRDRARRVRCGQGHAGVADRSRAQGRLRCRARRRSVHAARPDASAEARRYRRELSVFASPRCSRRRSSRRWPPWRRAGTPSNCRSGCSSRSPRRSSSGRARGSTPAHGRRCAAAPPTWTC